MREITLPVLVVCLVASFGTTAVRASQPAQAASSSAQSADKTPPSYDMKAQALEDLKDLQKKYTDLAGAVPQEKYTWRPAAGVRSFSELFLHVSAAGYGIPNMLGHPLPSGFDGKTFEKSTTDKAKVIEALNKSFASATSFVEGMTNADFAKLELKLGPQANDGDVVYILVTHAHEHLGQAIAYARMNSIVPPWTAAAAKKNPQAAQE